MGWGGGRTGGSRQSVWCEPGCRRGRRGLGSMLGAGAGQGSQCQGVISIPPMRPSLSLAPRPPALPPSAPPPSPDVSIPLQLWGESKDKINSRESCPSLHRGEGKPSQAHCPCAHTISPGKEQVKCKENPVSKNIPMTLSNIQLLAVGEQGAGWAGGSSVGQHSMETTEINRGGQWAGVPPTGPLPAHLPPTRHASLARLPTAAALTKHQAGRWL